MRKKEWYSRRNFRIEQSHLHQNAHHSNQHNPHHINSQNSNLQNQNEVNTINMNSKPLSVHKFTNDHWTCFNLILIHYLAQSIRLPPEIRQVKSLGIPDLILHLGEVWLQPRHTQYRPINPVTWLVHWVLSPTRTEIKILNYYFLSTFMVIVHPDNFMNWINDWLIWSSRVDKQWKHFIKLKKR